MARINKYQDGGINTNKYGTFTIDGTQYQVDDDFINQLSTFGNSLRNDVGTQFGKIIDALKTGENLEFISTGTGALDGKVNFDVTKQQNKRLRHKRSGFGNVLGGVNHGKEQDAREAIYALKNFHYNKPTEPIIEHNWTDTLQAEYETDQNGNYKKDTNGNYILDKGLVRENIIQRLKDLPNIANYKSTDKFEGHNKWTKDQYINWANNRKDKISEWITNLNNGVVTDEMIAALDDINIKLRPKDIKDEQSLSNRNGQNSYTSNNNTSLFKAKNLPYDQSKDLIVINNDGSISTVGDFWNQEGMPTNAIFNDAWYNMHQNPDLAWLKGYTKLGSHLYRTSDFNNPDSALYKWAHAGTDNFYNRNKSGNYSGADQLMTYQWGNTYEYTPFDSNNYVMQIPEGVQQVSKYRPVTGLIEDEWLKNNNINLASNDQIIEVPSDELNEFGTPKFHMYYILDENGRYKSMFTQNPIGHINSNDQPSAQFLRVITKDDLGNIDYNPTNKDGEYQDNTSNYLGKYQYTINTNDGHQVNLYINPNNPKDIILSDPYAFQAYKNLKDYDLLIDPNTIKGDNVSEQDVINAVISLITNKQKYDDWLRSYSNKKNRGRDDYANGIRNDWTLYRFAWPESTQVYQMGGIIGTSKSTKELRSKNSQLKSDQKYKSPSRVAGAHDDWEFTNADKWQLAGIAGDVASLIASIPTGGNPVAGLMGYGASGAQLVADIKRDGFQMSDFWNFASNALMDTVSLLPGIGITGKTGKMIKVLKRSYDLVKKGLSIAGATTAISSLNKLTRGEGDLNDWKNLSMGLMAFKNIGSGVRNLALTKYKGSVKPKTMSSTDYRNKYLDDQIKKNPQWVQDHNIELNANGTIKDYDKAFKILTDAKLIDKNKARKIIWNAKSGFNKSTDVLKNITWKHQFNPLSSNYKYAIENRVLKNTPTKEDLANANIFKRRALYDLSRQNPDIAASISQIGYVPVRRSTRLLWRHNPEFIPYSEFVQNGFKAARNGYASNRNSDLRDWAVDRNIRERKWGNVINNELANNNIQSNTPIIASQIPSYVDVTTLPTNNNTSPSEYISYMPLIENIIGRAHWNWRVPHWPNTPYNPEFSKFKIFDRSSVKVDEELSKWKKGGKLLKMKDGSQIGSEPGKSWKDNLKNINPDMPLGLADFIVSAMNIDKVNKKTKEAISKGIIGSQQQKSLEFYPRFSDYGINRMFNSRKNDIRTNQTVTSDPNQVSMDRLTRDMYIDKLQDEQDTKQTQIIDSYDNDMLARKQQYSNLRTQIDNENRSRLYQGLAQQDMADANKLIQHAQNVKNYIYQHRVNLGKDIEMRNRLNAQYQASKVNADYLKDLKALFDGKGGFNSVPDNIKDIYGNDWVGIISYMYPSEAANIKNKYEISMLEDMANSPTNRYSHFNILGDVKYDNVLMPETVKAPEEKIEKHKRGGSISRFRKLDEQSYLDQQKAINKVINDLNNNIIKLFIKMMS